MISFISRGHRAAVVALALSGAGAALGPIVTPAQAGEAPAGVYTQVGVSAGPGDCPTCTITIAKITPHLISIVANNNWLGYAVYTSGDKYVGHWEWKSGRGGPYEGQVFAVEFTYSDQKLLNMVARSAKGTIEAFYRIK